MPELPEVETIVRELKRKVLGRTFLDVWTDFKKMIKMSSFAKFKEEIKGKKVKKIWRKGKNILFLLSSGKILLIHQKLTGHLLFGKWKRRQGKWESLISGPLSDDPMNKFLHLIIWLDDGNMLALSDLRKFAKIELLDRKTLEREVSSLGADPIEKGFNLDRFKDCLKGKKGRIKQVLMNQKVIAGIGNIYSDEILWESRIHPFKPAEELKESEITRIYLAMKKILKKAIEAKGESISDFRRLSGEKGGFDVFRKVYRREGQKCFRCGSLIKKAKIGGRSTYFCPYCQKL